jgi:hypothetical protein
VALVITGVVLGGGRVLSDLPDIMNWEKNFIMTEAFSENTHERQTEAL